LVNIYYNLEDILAKNKIIYILLLSLYFVTEILSSFEDI